MSLFATLTGHSLLIVCSAAALFLVVSSSEKVRAWADVVACALLGAFAHALLLQGSGLKPDDWQLLSASIMVLSFSFMRWVLTRDSELTSMRGTADKANVEAAEGNLLSEQAIHHERLRILGTFSARIVHEINQPAAVMLLKLQELKRADARGDRQAVQKCFASLENQLQHLTQLSQAVRIFASPAQSSDVGFVKVQEIMHLLRDLSETWARESGVLVTWPKTLPEIEVSGDRTLHTQVLLNLVKNAVDAVVSLPDPQQRWIRIDIAERGGRAEFSVSNGGAPLSQRVQSNLFRPFFTSKRTGRGLGLGLTICRELVESVGGDIWYDESSQHPRFVVRFSFLPSIANSPQEVGHDEPNTPSPSWLDVA